MSTEPANPLFEGFKPQAIETPNQEPGGKPAKNPRKKRAKAEPEIPLSIKNDPPAKKPRKPRAPKAPKAPVPQNGNALQAILAASRILHAEDHPLFDKMIAADQASRKRIMSALAKIFS